MRLLAFTAARTVDGLFRAIDDQSLRFLPADAWFALHAGQGFRDRLDRLDRATDRAFVNLVEKAREFLGHAASVTDQHYQKMILQAADVAGAAGFDLAGLKHPPGAAESTQHLIEGGGADPGQATETGIVP